MRSFLAAFLTTVAGAFVLLATPLPACAQFGMGGGAGGAAGPGGVGQQPAPSGGGGEDEADELAEELNNEDPAIRLLAVQQLAASDDAKAVQYLIGACADTDTRVKLKAIDSLGTIRANGATPSLVQMLYLRESEPWLKQRVLVALGKIGDNRAARPVADLITRETDRRTVGTAIFALGEIGDSNTIASLEKMAEESDDPTIDRLATDAIAKINQRKINPEIEIQALRPDPNEVQRPASAGVGNPLAY